MADTIRVAVLYGFGINCDHETKAVFEMAGAEAERIHVNELVNGDKNLADYHIMAVPGGFSFGDHLGSGRLLGNRLRFGIRDMVQEFVKSGKLVIGICNGFQVLVKMGLLPRDLSEYAYPCDTEKENSSQQSMQISTSGQKTDNWWYDTSIRMMHTQVQAMNSFHSQYVPTRACATLRVYAIQQVVFSD